MIGSEEVINQPISLRDLLVKATLSPRVALDKPYPQIDLDVFGREAEGLLARSTADPKKRERSKHVLVTQQGDIQIQSEDNIGEETETGHQVKGSTVIRVVPDRQNLPREQKQREYLGMIMHVHPSDQAVTAADIVDLLRTENSIKIAPAMLVVSPQQKTLYCRSQETPQLSDKEVDKIADEWEQQLNTVPKRIKSQLTAAIKPELDFAQTQMEVFRLTSELCKKYKISRYSCPSSRNVATMYSA